MGTGIAFSQFNNQAIAGYEDLGDNGFWHMRESHRESIRAKWDRGGVFNTKLTTAGMTDNVFEIVGTALATDGEGHILDISNINNRMVLFENAPGVTYDVGLFYAEVPVGVRINPRLGKPQYYAFKEEIGRQGVPDSVVDNGDGTLTFVVNSVTQANVDFHDRLVVVFMTDEPARGATTNAIAIEQVQIVFAGGDNRITTAGVLGQTEVSTDPNDYTVVLLGASIAREADLSVEPGCFFIGSIVGNGGTPVAADVDDQFVFKTFEDASQIAYSYPGQWFGSVVNVEDALNRFNEILNGSIDGGRFLTVETNTFARANVDLSMPLTEGMGGIGNHLDIWNPDEQGSLVSILEAVDAALRRIRTFSATVSDRKFSSGFTRESDYDAEGGPNAAVMHGGTFMFRPLNNPATQPYQITADNAMSVDVAPYVIGERSSPVGASISQGLDRTLVKWSRDGDPQRINPGHWTRVFFDADGVGKYMHINGSGSAPGGIFEDVLFRGGRVSITGMDETRGDNPVHIRNCVFDPISGSHPLAATLLFGGPHHDRAAHVLIENCVIYGPAPDQFLYSDLAALGIPLSFGKPGGVDSGVGRPVTFRNCVFIARRTDVPLTVIRTESRIVFETCHFYGMEGQTVPVVTVGTDTISTFGNVVFRDCTIHAPEGQCIDWMCCDGSVQNLVLTTGATGAAVADPIVARFVGGERGLAITNVYVSLRDSAIRTGAFGEPEPTRPLLIFGMKENGFVQGSIKLQGMTIEYHYLSANLHAADTLAIFGTSNGSSYSDVTLKCGGKARAHAGIVGVPGLPAHATTNCIVTIVGANPIGSALDRVFVRGLKVEDIYSPASSGYDTAIVGAKNAVLDGVVTRRFEGASNGHYRYGVLLTDNALLRDYTVADPVLRYAYGVAAILGDRNTISHVQLPTLTVSLELGALLYMNGSNNHVGEIEAIVSSMPSYGLVFNGDYNNIEGVNVRFTSNTLTTSPALLTTRQSILTKCRFQWNGTDHALFDTGEFPSGGSNTVHGNYLARMSGTNGIFEGANSSDQFVGFNGGTNFS